MSDSSRFATRNRLVVEGEQLVLHSVSNGVLDLVSVADVREWELAVKRSRNGTLWRRIAHCFESVVPGETHPVATVWVPSGTHLILKNIPTSLQQRYGLEEEEGAIYLRPDAEDGKFGGELRFNNGALIPLQDLRVGQLLEVLSLAGTQPMLYEAGLQMK